MLDGRLVAFQRTARRPLRRPPERPQDPPGVDGGVLDPAFPLDQIRDAPRRPQARAISERFGAAFESRFDAPQIRRGELRWPPGPRGTLERLATAGCQLRRPAVHRLAVHAESARDLGLAQAFFEQARGVQAPPLQLHAIEPNAGGMSHARQYTRITRECH